jgi:hypothetical protein
MQRFKAGESGVNEPQETELEQARTVSSYNEHVETACTTIAEPDRSGNIDDAISHKPDTKEIFDDTLMRQSLIIEHVREATVAARPHEGLSTGAEERLNESPLAEDSEKKPDVLAPDTTVNPPEDEGFTNDVDVSALKHSEACPDNNTDSNEPTAMPAVISEAEVCVLYF